MQNKPVAFEHQKDADTSCDKNSSKSPKLLLKISLRSGLVRSSSWSLRLLLSLLDNGLGISGICLRQIVAAQQLTCCNFFGFLFRMAFVTLKRI